MKQLGQLTTLNKLKQKERNSITEKIDRIQAEYYNICSQQLTISEPYELAELDVSFDSSIRPYELAELDVSFDSSIRPYYMSNMDHTMSDMDHMLYDLSDNMI